MGTMRRSDSENEAFRAFLRRVWQEDAGPLLRGRHAEQRKKAARATGKAAAAAGLIVDGLFRLRGRPFTRLMTVMGTRVGAMLPDVWDWQWLRDAASEADRQTVADRIRHKAAVLPERAALELFGLSPQATRDDLRSAWREVTQRWHPDKAPDDGARREYHLRFIAYKAAYDHLCQAYDAGRLPA